MQNPSHDLMCVFHFPPRGIFPAPTWNSSVALHFDRASQRSQSCRNRKTGEKCSNIVLEMSWSSSLRKSRDFTRASVHDSTYLIDMSELVLLFRQSRTEQLTLKPNFVLPGQRTSSPDMQVSTETYNSCCGWQSVVKNGVHLAVKIVALLE